MRFSLSILIKQKVLRMPPQTARPEIADWLNGDEVGGQYSWDCGRFQGINNAGRIVFSNYNGLNEIALWRGCNNDLKRRLRRAANERRQNRLEASLRPSDVPQPVDWAKTDEPNYKPGQWVN